MNNRPSLIFTIVILLLIKPAYAQETKIVRDLGLWTGVAVEKTVKKRWTFSLKQEVRLKNDISELNNYFTQAGINYSINKNFSLEGDYRFIQDKNREGKFETRSRYNFDFRYKGKLDFITILYRLRYQKEIEGLKIFDLQEPYEKYLRNRITLRYNKLRRVKPYLSTELFQLFEPYQLPRYHYMRMLAGISYEPRKIGEFNAAYGFNHELNTSLPATFFVIKIKYTYSF